MVDWFCKPKTDSLLSLRAVTPPEEAPPPDIPHEPSFYLEPDRIAGLGPEPPTPEDELVTIFLSSMAGYIMKRCETEECMRRVNIIKPPPPPPPKEESEEEDVPVTSEVDAGAKEKKVSKGFAKRKSKAGGKQSVTAAPKKHVEKIAAVHAAPEEEEQEENQDRKSVTSFKRKTQTSLTKLELEEKPKEQMEELEEEETEHEEEQEKIIKRLGKSHASMEEVDRKFFSWKFRELDQMVDIDFIHHNRYNGRLSRMLMEEHGKFTWNNGQTYKGTFKKGNCDGTGLIEWNANSIYEGQVHCNFRHGFGVKTYGDKGRRMYHAGLWKMGKKDGPGLSVYDEESWYDGEWQDGLRHGVGTRRYKNGTRYYGEWYQGMRHGKGTMVWPNNDVYMGEWNFGQMHGKGKYTWNSFMNERLLSPLLNTYTGEWSQSKRHGEGVLELRTGAVIKTKWHEGAKTGTAEIICRNGNVLHIEDLFKEDRVSQITKSVEYSAREKVAQRRRSVMNNQNLVKIRLHNDEPQDDLRFSETSMQAKDDNINLYDTHLIPLNSPVYTMDFSRHINKLFEIKCTSLLPIGPDDPQPPEIPAWEKRAITWLENKWLQKVIIHRMADLTKVYNFYALILNDLNVPDFKFCMHRLALWLLMKHCGIVETGITTVKLDEMVGFGHEPFDKIMMYEMINYLLEMSWLRYVPKRIKNPDIPGIIAACFDKFIEDVVNTAPSKYDGRFHKYLRYTPFESLVKLFNTFEYPLLIEDLCARLLYVPSRDFEDRLPFTPEFYRYIMQGKNIVGPDGYLSYIPFEEPNFDINLMRLRPETITPADLRVLGSIGIDNIIRCIKEAVPEAINLVTDELDSEFQLSFNEFCDILVNLVTMYLDLAEEFYRKLLSDQDKDNVGGDQPMGMAESAWEGGKDPSKTPPTTEGGTSPPAKNKSLKRKSMKRQSRK